MRRLTLVHLQLVRFLDPAVLAFLRHFSPLFAHPLGEFFPSRLNGVKKAGNGGMGENCDVSTSSAKE